MMTSNMAGEQSLARLEGSAQTQQLQRRTELQQNARKIDLPSTFSSSLRRLRTPGTLGPATLTPPGDLSSHAALAMETAPEQLPLTPTSADLNADLNQTDDNRLEVSEGDWPVRTDDLSYDVPVSSGQIWRFHGSSIYVAPAEELLSQAIREKWKDFIIAFQANFAHVKAEMIAEQCKSKQLRKKGCNLTNFMLEVRISGRRETPLSRSIRMGPCLWILCGSKWCQKRIRGVARHLTLPVDLSLQQIEVHTGFPVPNALESMVPMSQLPSDKTINWGLNHLGGHILYHLEGQELASGQFSACGLLCCATYVKDGKVVKQHVSRIGGLLTFGKNGYRIESENAAVTTAHGVFDHLWSLNDSEDDEDDEYDEMEEEGFSSGSESADSSDRDRNEGPTSSMKNTSMVGEKHASEVQLWLPLTVHAVKYLSRQFLKGGLDNEGISAAADYAILGSRILRVFENVVDSTTGATIITHARNDELDEGPIVLLLGYENNLEATLLPGTLKLSMGDSEVAVRKIRLRAALAPGTSGTWLVRESKFCGMIIAAYPGEPLALFMTADDILENIEVTFPGVLNMDADPDALPQCEEQPRLHERGDSLPNFRPLPVGEDSSSEDTFRTKKPDSSVANSPIKEDSDCINMAPTQQDDTWQESQGTIRFLSERALKYNPISDREFFFTGRVIQVSGQDADQSVSGCAMVVLAVSNHGFPQCLMLCQHHGQEGDKEEKNFWEAHSAVYPSTLKAVDRNTAYEYEKPNPPITVDISSSLLNVVELAENCFINYQHTWSLRKDMIKIATIGKIQGKDLKLLKNNYRETQKRMYSEK